jgi:hypothetical protein
VLADFPETITRRAATPAVDHLFEIRDIKGGQNNKQQTSVGIPPHRGTATIHGHKGQKRYTNSSGISYHKGKEARQGRLGGTEVSAEILEWDQIFEAKVERGQSQNAKVVC